MWSPRVPIRSAPKLLKAGDDAYRYPEDLNKLSSVFANT